MKKVLFVLVLFGFGVCEKVKITNDCNVRKLPTVKSAFIFRVTKNEVYNSIGVYGDYSLIKIISNSSMVGKEGWIYNNLLTNNIVKSDASVREKPIANSKVSFTVKKDTVIEISGLEITWYKISNVSGCGWIYSGAVEKIKE